MLFSSFVLIFYFPYFYIGTPHCDILYSIRQFVTLFDAVLKSFSRRYVKDFLYEYFLHAFIHTYTEERVGGSTKMCMCVCVYMCGEVQKVTNTKRLGWKEKERWGYECGEGEREEDTHIYIINRQMHRQPCYFLVLMFYVPF